VGLKDGETWALHVSPPLLGSIGYACGRRELQWERREGQRERARARASAMETEGGGLGWGSGEISAHICFSLFFGVQVAGQELVQETWRGGWEKSSRHRRRPSHRADYKTNTLTL